VPHGCANYTLLFDYFQLSGAVGFVAENLRNVANEWSKYTSDIWILQTVAEGYRLEFANALFQVTHPNPIHFVEHQWSCIQD
jgi:hypothetical protein